MEETDFDLEKLGRMQHESAWVDVENKARRLVFEQRIRVQHKRPYDLNRPTAEVEIRAQVAGDHARYETVIILPEPRSAKIRTFTCQCTWNRYVWNRRPIYVTDRDGRRREVNKRYEGRVCSHVLGLYWMTQLWPVDYSEVEDEVLRHFADRILEQNSLFPDDYEALNEVQEAVDISRISPQEFGFTDEVEMNKSIQQTLEGFFPSVDEAVNDMFDENGQPTENQYDTPETMDLKNKILEEYERLFTLNDLADKLRDELYNAQSLKKRREITERLNRTLQRTDTANAVIDRLLRDIRRIYNYEFETQPNLKAQDAVKQLNWYMVNDPQRARKYMGDLGVQYNREAEKLDQLEPGAGQKYREEVDQMPLKNFSEIVQRMIAERAAIELERKRQQPPDQRQSSVSVLTTDFHINDITIHLQKELAEGRNPSGFVRRELWGEQRGGLHPHPDAMPIRIRNDGNHVFSPEDLGYNPETGQMGTDKEERGSYGRIDIGGEVRILSVDPRDRLVLAEHLLDNPHPNHQHIRIWIPLRDIDLV